MTTIAANRREMVADTKVATGETWFQGRKLYRFKRDIIGAAGDVSAIEKFFDWYKAGHKKKHRPKFGKGEIFEALILTPRGLWQCDKSSLWMEPVLSDYHAIGTGAIAALVAMDLGLEPVAAVEAACRRDANSGLPVERMGI